MNKIELYKNLAWKIRYEAGDMPYPPVLFWEDSLNTEDIINGWTETIKIITNQKENHNMGLYVHIPFCFTRCYFCTCTTTVEHNETKYEEYLNLIEKECQLFEKIFRNVEFNTVYVGGGTPTILTHIQIDRFYKILKKYFNLKKVKQIMTEGSPYTTTEEKMKVIASHGINKMTFGVQSLDSKTLKSNNRFQQFEDVKKAVNLARKYGIEYINLDVMAGLPEQDFDGFKETIRLIESLEPTTVHINAFWPTKTTNYAKSGGYYDEDNIKLRNNMEQFGKYLEDKESKITDTRQQNLQLYNAHNQNSSILGLGFGAISHAFGSLHYHKKNFEDYKKFVNGEDVTITGIKLSKEDEIITYLINNLRSGVYFDRINSLFEIDIQKTEIYLSKIIPLINKGIIMKFSDEYSAGIRFKNNSDLYCSIYSKALYNDELMNKFEKIVTNNSSMYSNTNFKLKQFFSD